MDRARFRLTFLWRFTLVTVVVSVVAAFLLASAVENAHRAALLGDIEVNELGRVGAEITSPLRAVAARGFVDRAARNEFDRVRSAARRDEYLSDLRIYRPNGDALYPRGARNAMAAVHAALAADSFVAFDDGATITAYTPYFTQHEQSFVIAVDLAEGQLKAQFAKERRQVFEVVAGVVAIIFFSLVTLAAGASRELERRRREAQQTFVQTLTIMAETIDLRDPYTAGHSQRVATYSRKLATAARLPQRQIDLIESGALLHDIGKIAVPDVVLFKAAELDVAERRIISTHPTVGAKLLSGIASMEDVVPCVLHHHEKIDGSGYPDKLRGDEIPIGARVIAVADSFDAMTTDRPYRRALSASSAVAELQRVAGAQLDARLVALFAGLVASGAIVPPPSAAVDAAVTFGRREGASLATR